MNGLEICNLSFSYGHREVLKNISFQVQQGSFCAFLGGNGAGKSTLVRCINGLLRTDGECVVWNGIKTGKLNIKERARVYGYVPQNTQAGYSLNVMEIVLSGRLPHMGVKAGKSDLEKAAGVMEEFHLQDYAFRPFKQLSGGERQRVLIARAVAQEPQLLLLDEPTSSLDLRYQYEVMDLLRHVCRRGITVAAVIHDLNLALDYADTAVLLTSGTVTAMGTPAEVLTPERILTAYGVQTETYQIGSRSVILRSGNCLRQLSEQPLLKQGLLCYLIEGGDLYAERAGYRCSSGFLSPYTSKILLINDRTAPAPLQNSRVPRWALTAVSAALPPAAIPCHSTTTLSTGGITVSAGPAAKAIAAHSRKGIRPLPVSYFLRRNPPPAPFLDRIHKHQITPINREIPAKPTYSARP